MLQESQASFGNHQHSQTPIDDELDAIYLSQTDTSANDQTHTECVANPDGIKNLYHIGDNLSEARLHRLNTQFFTHAEHQTNFIGSVAKVIFGRDVSQGRLESLTEARLRSEESVVGAQIFGEIAENERREFWYHTRHHGLDSWYFHQEITDSSGLTFEVTLHYEVHPNGVLRISSNSNTPNEFIHGQELNNLLSATEIYHDRVINQLYPNTPRVDDAQEQQSAEYLDNVYQLYQTDDQAQDDRLVA